MTDREKMVRETIAAIDRDALVLYEYGGYDFYHIAAAPILRDFYDKAFQAGYTQGQEDMGNVCKNLTALVDANADDWIMQRVTELKEAGENDGNES